MAIHSLLLQRNNISKNWKRSSITAFEILQSVHEKFQINKFHEGKHMWLNQFFRVNSPTWNSFGSTYDYSLCKIPVATTYKSTCNNQACSEPVKVKISPILGYIQGATNKTLQAGINKWLDNAIRIHCTKCPGMRSYSRREFVTQDTIIYVDVSNNPWSIPLSLNIKLSKYQLRMITYGNGGHFCSSILINNRWYTYDGLKEYHSPGSGLKRIIKPTAQPGYFPDYALFCECI